MSKKLRLQVRAARTLLDWHQKTLARAAGVTPQTISSLEGGGAVNEATRRVVIAALEKAGVELLDGVEGVSGPGARLDWPKWLERKKENAGGGDNAGTMPSSSGPDPVEPGAPSPDGVGEPQDGGYVREGDAGADPE